MLAGWLAGWLARSWLARDWQAGWFAGQKPAGWQKAGQAGWLAGQAGWLVGCDGWLAGWLAGWLEARRQRRDSGGTRRNVVRDWPQLAAGFLRMASIALGGLLAGSAAQKQEEHK
jgi:uncharacterized membrane protein YeaQ/YmgE (transglycosylase-associated protein family)